MKTSLSQSKAQGGFVLALTILILAAVLATATAFAVRLRMAQEAAERNKAYVEAQLAFESTQADLTVRLAALPRTVEGIGGGIENRLIPDGRHYRTGEFFTAQLQDSRGLINLNGGVPTLWQNRLLQTFGIGELEGEALLDVLKDYIDPDNLRRINGAEADDYQALGLPSPRNDILVSPKEIRGMPRWRNWPTLWENGFLDHVTTGTQGSINPNTASWQVLASVPRITPEAAKALVEIRKTGHLLSLVDLIGAGAEQNNYLNLNVALIPSPTTLVTHWSTHLGWGRRYSITITPFSEYGPWRVDYIDQVPKSAQFPRPEQWAQLPGLDRLRLAQQLGQAASPPMPGGGGLGAGSGGGPGSTR